MMIRHDIFGADALAFAKFDQRIFRSFAVGMRQFWRIDAEKPDIVALNDQTVAIDDSGPTAQAIAQRGRIDLR